MKFVCNVRSASFVRHQRGAVLFVSLMFLVIIALLAITSSGTSIMEERMTGGLRNRQLSTFSAETALRAAEVKLWSSAALPTPTTLCVASTGTPIFGVYSYNARNPNLAVRKFRTSHVASTFVADSAAGKPLTSMYSGIVDLANPGAAADLSSKVVANPYVLVEDLGEEACVPLGTSPGMDCDAKQHDSRSGYGPGAPPGQQPPPKHLFRITARSQGGTDAVMRIVESTFAAPCSG